MEQLYRELDTGDYKIVVRIVVRPAHEIVCLVLR
jgi:hypothetical protein